MFGSFPGQPMGGGNAPNMQQLLPMLMAMRQGQPGSAGNMAPQIPMPASPMNTGAPMPMGGGGSPMNVSQPATAGLSDLLPMLMMMHGQQNQGQPGQQGQPQAAPAMGWLHALLQRFGSGAPQPMLQSGQQGFNPIMNGQGYNPILGTSPIGGGLS